MNMFAIIILYLSLIEQILRGGLSLLGFKTKIVQDLKPNEGLLRAAIYGIIALSIMRALEII